MIIFKKKKLSIIYKKINLNSNFGVVLDVGAHEGESIELFLKNFNIDYIYSFEPSELTYKKLLANTEKLKKKYINTHIQLENYAVGNSNKDVELNYLNETSSSTLRDININSKYFKRKEKYFGKLINKKIFVKQISFKRLFRKKRNKKN